MGAGARDRTLPATRRSSSCASTGRKPGATLLVRRDADGALLVRAEDFAGLRLRPPQEATVLVDGMAYFRVDATMGADVRFDGATQSVDLTLPADAFVPTVTALHRRCAFVRRRSRRARS